MNKRSVQKQLYESKDLNYLLINKENRKLETRKELLDSMFIISRKGNIYSGIWNNNELKYTNKFNDPSILSSDFQIYNKIVPTNEMIDFTKLSYYYHLTTLNSFRQQIEGLISIRKLILIPDDFIFSSTKTFLINSINDNLNQILQKLYLNNNIITYEVLLIILNLTSEYGCEHYG